MSSNFPNIDRPVTGLALWSPAVLFLLYFGGALAGWLLQVSGAATAAQIIGGAYAHCCHQIPQRSFDCAGAVIPLCARCTGFFGGLAVTSLVVLLRKSPRSLPWVAAVLLCLPMFIDAAFDLSAATAAANPLRALTGVAGGCALAAALYPKFIAAVRDQLALQAARA